MEVATQLSTRMLYLARKNGGKFIWILNRSSIVSQPQAIILITRTHSTKKDTLNLPRNYNKHLYEMIEAFRYFNQCYVHPTLIN
jgi:hypothetical protein